MRGRPASTFTAASLCVLPSRALADRGARFEHHAGGRRFPPARRIQTDHRRLLDLRMFAQDRLQIARVDVEPAGDDHVLLSVEQHQKTIGIEPADVSGADESLAARVVPLRFPGLCGLIQVAAHHRGRVTDDFADFAARQLLSRRIDQADIVARHRHADRVQFVWMLVGLEQARAAAFGEPVDLDEAPGPTLKHAPLELRCKRRAGRELQLK